MQHGKKLVGAGLGFVLVVLCFGLQGAAQTGPVCCKIPQSPRRLLPADWNYRSAVPTVWKGANETTIKYSPRAGVEMTLNRCSQHYHCRIENVQACSNEMVNVGKPLLACEPPRVGDRIEIHTAYHAGPLRVPTPEGIDQCTVGPVVVVGYHATVSAESHPGGIPVPIGPDSAEWSGSTTNEDTTPGPECKAAAYWSFTLGCNFTIGKDTLQRAFTHPDPARGVQSGDRVSQDLTHVMHPQKH